jgi:hypothetical protein
MLSMATNPSTATKPPAVSTRNKSSVTLENKRGPKDGVAAATDYSSATVPHPNACELDLSFLGIPTSAPMFTTPTLDFESHSMELASLVEAAEDFIQSFYSRHSPFPNRPNTEPHFASSPSSVLSQPSPSNNVSTPKPLPIATAGPGDQKKSSNGTSKKPSFPISSISPTSANQVSPPTTSNQFTASVMETASKASHYRDECIAAVLAAVIAHFNLLTTPHHLKRRKSIISYDNCNGRTPKQQQQCSPTTSPVPCSSSSPDFWCSLPAPHKFDSSLPASARARYHYLRGKVFSMIPDSILPRSGSEVEESNNSENNIYGGAMSSNGYEKSHQDIHGLTVKLRDSTLLDDLSRSVKLDPELYAAWNLLGEIRWLKDGAEGKRRSRNCFEMGLLYVSITSEGIVHGYMQCSLSV